MDRIDLTQGQRWLADSVGRKFLQPEKKRKVVRILEGPWSYPKR